MCPGMITSEGKKIERFIWGLNTPIQGNVIAANQETYDSAKRLAKKLYDHGNKKGAKAGETEGKKEGKITRRTKTTNERDNKAKSHRKSSKL